MRRSLVIASIASALAFALLVGLGVWQMQRLQWKQQLTAKIEKRTAAEPLSIDDALVRWGDTGDVEFARVLVHGKFLHDRELHLYALRDGTPGWRIVTPLDTDDAQIILVDRGFVPDALKDAQKRRQGQVDGEVSLTGAARAPALEQGQFIPDNDQARNIWYWRDLEAMGSAALEPDQLPSLVPFYVEAHEPAPPGGWPRPHAAAPRIPNRHLEYALTWFALAGILAVMYVLFLRANLRRKAGQP